jgi:membrane protease YdiL (CAAX protease family)
MVELEDTVQPCGDIMKLIAALLMKRSTRRAKYWQIAYAFFIASAVLLNFVTSELMVSTSKYTSLDLLGTVILWGLVFSLANGFMEELWFRGIFMGKLQPLIGPVFTKGKKT